MAEEETEKATLLLRQGESSNYQALSNDAETKEKESTGAAHDNTAFIEETRDGDEIEDIYEEVPTAATSQARAAPVAIDVPRERPVTEDELMFRLRFAHLAPNTDWFDEVAAVSRTNGDPSVYEHVLATLREYPMTIQDKLMLSGQIRARLEAGSLASAGSVLHQTRRDKEKRKKRAKSSHVFSFASGGFVPFALWEGLIGRISAYFGTNVASYFQFLRFLVLLNLGVGMIMLIFVSLPQIVSDELSSNDVKSGFFGELSDTIFFYGAYNDRDVTNDDLDLTYSKPLAYLMTWSCVIVLAIFVIVLSMFVSYRRIKKTDDEEDPFSSQTLLSWDHSVTSREGSKIRASAITTQFKEMVREEKVRARLSRKQRLQRWAVRILCNLLCIAILAGSAYLIYLVAENTVTSGLEIPEVVGDFFEKYQLPLLVSALKLVIPPMLDLLLKLEKYHPRTQIKLQITRTAVFYVASLVVFLASVYSVSTECLTAKNSNSTNTNVTSNSPQEAQSEYCCWENEVGEQLFQMVILDMAISLVVGLLFKGGRAAFMKCCNYTRFGYEDFSVAGLFLDLVYGQSLIWLGLYFAPFFALVGLVKLVILFYFNYVLARLCCVPPTKIFRASRSGTFYLFILLVTLFACLIPMTYAIIQIEPSGSCGPFKNNTHVYEVLTNRIGESPDWIQDIINFASTSAFVVPLLIILILLVLYYRAKSSTHKMAAKELRFHLQFERKVEKRRVFARARLVQGMSVVSGLDNMAKAQETPVDS